MYTGIIVYTIIWFLACVIVYRNYTKNKIIARRYGYEMKAIYKNKMPIISAITIAALFTLFNVYATENSIAMGGDRQNYLYNFMGYREAGSIGLGFLMDLTHYLGGDFETLLYFTTFSCTFITMIAYRFSKQAKPYCFYLLCITQYFLTTLVALKQCYASAFAVLFFVLVLEYNTKTSNLASILCVIIACLFHSTGFVLAILYFAIKIEKKTKYIFPYLFLLLLISFFFERVMVISASIIRPVFPLLSLKILQYFGEVETIITDGIGFGFLKGIPYYFITLLGLIHRKTAKLKIEHYDEYLLIVATGAFLYFMSIFSGWISRFVYLFSFVSFVFFVQLLNNVKLRGNRVIYNFIVQCSLLITTYRFLYLVYSLYGGF